MKANQLATLVLRLLGIYCLIVLIPMAELLNGCPGLSGVPPSGGENRVDVELQTQIGTSPKIGIKKYFPDLWIS